MPRAFIGPFSNFSKKKKKFIFNFSKHCLVFSTFSQVKAFTWIIFLMLYVFPIFCSDKGGISPSRPGFATTSFNESLTSFSFICQSDFHNIFTHRQITILSHWEILKLGCSYQLEQIISRSTMYKKWSSASHFTVLNCPWKMLYYAC